MGLMDAFRSKTPQEVMRENKRMLDRSIRELDRERMTVETQVKRTLAEMKKVAKAGQEEAVRMMAKDVVRMRGQVTKFYKMRAQMQSVSMQLQTMKSQAAMCKAMGGVTRSLAIMNKQMNTPAMQHMMMEFEKQSEVMEFKQELMDDTMDDVLAGEDEEERTEEMVSQVLDEIGISMGSSMAAVPAGAASPMRADSKLASPAASEDADLQARLDSLRALK